MDRVDPARASTNQAVLELGSGLGDGLGDVPRQMDVLLEQGPRVLVVDLSEEVHLSSSTIAALMWVRRCASARGVVVVLRETDRSVVDMMQRSGLIGALGLEPVSTPPEPSHAGVTSSRRAR